MHFCHTAGIAAFAGISVFDGLAVFPRLRRLTIITIIYIYIYIYGMYTYAVVQPETRWKILRIRLRKGNDRLGKLAIGTRFVNVEENGCRFVGQRKEICIYTRLARLIAVRERMLEFYSE